VEEKDQMMPAPEHTHGAHAHGTGHKWLDVVVAVSAIFISVVSLVVSIEHGRTMEKMVDQNQKMVEASTLPLLTEDTSFTNDPDNPRKAQIKLVLKNGGIGPAIIGRFEFSYKGQSFDSSASTFGKLLGACCVSAAPKSGTTLPASAAAVTGTVLPARESVTILGIAPQTKELYQAMTQAAREVKMKACYCSVLNECWETEFTQQRPKPVADCTAKPGETLW
jgi:hypothetical protein